MKINVHAGHNPDGKPACGAVGLIKESTQARKVKKLIIQYLKEAGHTVYDCTCSNGENQSDVLSKIVKKCNAHSVDIDVSVHFNSGAGDEKGNGRTTGAEILVYSETKRPEDSKAYLYADRTLKKIAALGFKNRGIKVRNDLYVLKNTKSKAMLIECCFVDDKDDVKLYNADKMARAIAEGIMNQAAEKQETKGSSAVYKVTAKNGLNVRRGPGTNHEKVTVLVHGEKISVSKISDGWGKVEKGWICMKYLDKI